ncbi:LacI family DNA-binding transcriptional regulator [Hydrogenobacter sp. T-2]|uniref:RNA polymerase factor sigma-54 n=1 Tax=Pampinifervens diazotrophicum TaxID=1632018 RepID=UPI002B25AE73|nr:RNA polymerase subunit sigma-54 [Hydrogenobacter sp. T-2]WPM32249.1 LacI family DNA-binding transcriptional regulator [Hydrogenobacter sp. T-2]
MKDKPIRVLPQVKTSMLLKIENSLELLLKTSEELLQELELKQEENPQIKLTLKTKPRWFYEEYTERQPIFTQSEISKVEEQVRYEFDGLDLDIALEIISGLNHKGFFLGDIGEIAKHYGVSPEYVEEIREFIMKEIEPLGAASRNLEEFILVQLEELYPKEEELHREVLKVLKGKSKDLRAREVLSRLKLSPFEGSQAAYKGGSVDVVFEYDGSQWYVFLMEDFWDVEAVGSLKPITFILEMRRRVMRVVGDLILERQAGFMLGKEPLKSLTLSEVAQRAEVSLSTVSRIVSRKYAKTPIGVFPLRSFFLRETKEGYSKEEIMKAIKEILQSEKGRLSDQEISKLLKDRGIHIARRTVNKYRRILEGRS